MGRNMQYYQNPGTACLFIFFGGGGKRERRERELLSAGSPHNAWDEWDLAMPKLGFPCESKEPNYLIPLLLPPRVWRSWT